MELLDVVYTIRIMHYLVSCVFLIVAIWLLIRTILGVFRKKEYSILDKYLSFAFIVNLYLQLIFGLILFTNMGLDSSSEFINTGQAVTKRLWPVEHIVIMLFALFIAHLGFILSYKSQTSHDKHKKILIYYTISVLLVIISLGSIYLL